MFKDDIVIVNALRTPIGAFGGAFKNIKAPELAVPVIKELLKKSEINPDLIDDVIFGCAYQRTRNETNLARVASIRAGIPYTVPGVTIQRVCTSAMWAIASGAQAIKAGDAQVILAGGVESMSTVPYTIDAMRWGARMMHVEANDALWDGLTSLGVGPAMGITAENLAEKYRITREEQDQVAYNSHIRAVKAEENGKFKDEIVPVLVPSGRDKYTSIKTDEGPRNDTSLEKLAKLRPIFKKDGTVTAGNSSSINDGAAGVIIMKYKKAEELGLKPMARIVSYAVAGVDPNIMGIGPVPASLKALSRANLTIKDLDLIEVNEAFAAQYLAVERELNLNRELTNVNGSGISMGHPVGATGCRIVVTLLHEMEKRESKYGLAALCGGGGVGMAIVVERYPA
ncbi:thiolase family protein [bacterium]|nr:thiolase family protein [bacterium]